MNNTSRRKWAGFIMFLAAIYNLFWGAVISLFPQIILFGNAPASYTLIILKCVGMLVGVYGIAYYYASKDPVRYWPLIFVGFIGKVLGPIGAIYYVIIGEMPANFLLVNVFNDFIWLIPFGWVLYHALTGGLFINNIKGNNKSLYQEFLGDEFDKLSPNLKRFHQSKINIAVSGEFKVTRGTNLISNILANVAGLPKNNNAAKAELIVHPNINSETWNRRLGDKNVISKQWLENKLLVERFKIVRIHLAAEVKNGNLAIYDVFSTVLWIPMPPFLTPTVYATGEDINDGIAIEVEIGFKPFGRIINYRGIVKPDAASRNINS